MINTQPKTQPRLHSFQMSIADANAFIELLHRTHGPVKNHRFTIGAMDQDGRICGAAIVGRPVCRHTDQIHIAEIVRLVSDGTPNVCSFLMAQCANVCTLMGFRRIQTFVPQGENSSLKALKSSGWISEHITRLQDGWEARKATLTKGNIIAGRIGVTDIENIKVQPRTKVLWAKELNANSPVPSTESLMPKITDEPLRVIQVRIFDRDYHRLQEMFGGDPTFSMNKAVRTMVRTMLNQLEAKVNAAIDSGEKADIKIDFSKDDIND